MCSLVPESPGQHVEYTPGGLLYKPGGSQLQHATTISFLLLVYAQYLSRSSLSLNCGSLSVPPDHLRRLAKKQVSPVCSDYWLFSYLTDESPKPDDIRSNYHAFIESKIIQKISRLLQKLINFILLLLGINLTLL